MICKFCNAQIEDDSVFCPICGMGLTEEETPVMKEETPVAEISTEEAPAEEAPVAEEPVEEAPAEEAPAEEAPVTEESAEEAPVEATPVEEVSAAEPEPVVIVASKPKVWPIVLAAVGSVLALAVLAVVLLAALGVEIKLPSNDIFRKESYTVSKADAVEKGDDVVAKVGNKKLTNGLLQIYYRMKVLDFVNYYGNYLSQVNFDFAKPLSEQTSYFDESMSWEQYFIDASIQTWSNYQSLCLAAEAAGFTLAPEVEAELEKIPASLEEQALQGEYESADAMIKELLGPACDMETYMEYIRIDTVANTYYSTEYEKLLPTDAEVEEYFAAHEQDFAVNGVTKDGGLVSSVRHILVCPKVEEKSTESTEPTDATEPTEAVDANGFTEAQWAECLARAEKILQEWKDGEATEESFAALVGTYTEDPGSASTGGLYEGINPTSSYVENFLNWSVDMSRQPGDTDIVQTEYGYHIMYFVKGTPYWMDSAKTQLLSERTNKMLEECKEKYPATVTFKNIALSDLELA